jgi:hypothetical protein
VRWIVELNYPGAQVPDVWRDFSEAEDLDARAKRDQIISGMGYEPKSPKYIDDTYGGEWVKKTSTPPVTDDPDADGTTAGEASALDQLFADRQEPAGDDTDSLSDQLEVLAAPQIDKMIEAIRAEVDAAVSYDDLATRLLRLSSEIGVDDLGGLMEQASIVADLSGRASVIDEGGARGD